ncbi:hypothetical protein DVH05_025729 [Phytophthora capsici]|nr:hypothetical protein DVH05_025729 [Phytophthora capsici]
MVQPSYVSSIPDGCGTVNLTSAVDSRPQRNDKLDGKNAPSFCRHLNRSARPGNSRRLHQTGCSGIATYVTVQGGVGVADSVYRTNILVHRRKLKLRVWA